MYWFLFKNCFRLSIFMFILISLTSCGETIELSQPSEVVLKNQLEGHYYFPDGGIVRVEQDEYSRITITMTDQIVSTNPKNKSLGEHPKTTITDQFTNIDGTLYFSTNVNYNGGDLEEDISGANITGQRRTNFKFQWAKNTLILNIKVFETISNNNINKVVLDRFYKGVR